MKGTSSYFKNNDLPNKAEGCNSLILAKGEKMNELFKVFKECIGHCVRGIVSDVHKECL